MPVAIQLASIYLPIYITKVGQKQTKSQGPAFAGKPCQGVYTHPHTPSSPYRLALTLTTFRNAKSFLQTYLALPDATLRSNTILEIR